ncbi:AAA family ATPase [Streptomyces sp. NPDC088736]|uniref:AAA family ATPase n=1 Tax=Streptomyces sp. NPDC088736 TaxID=3365881 RepID=UPI0037F67CE0
MLILPVGAPGSGKSHLADSLVKLGYIDAEAVVATDQYRRVMTGNRRNNSLDDDVYLVCLTIARSRLRMKLNVYFDATNLDIERIKGLISTAGQYGEETVTVFLDADLETCLKRNRGRPFPVVEERIIKAVERYDLLDRSVYPGTQLVPDSLIVWLNAQNA